MLGSFVWEKQSSMARMVQALKVTARTFRVSRREQSVQWFAIQTSTHRRHIEFSNYLSLSAVPSNPWKDNYTGVVEPIQRNWHVCQGWGWCKDGQGSEISPFSQGSYTCGGRMESNFISCSLYSSPLNGIAISLYASCL